MDYKNNLNYDNWGNPTYDYLDSKFELGKNIRNKLGTIGMTKVQADQVVNAITDRWGFYGVNSLVVYEDDDEEARLTNIMSDFMVHVIFKRIEFLYNKYKYIIEAYDTINVDLIKSGIVYQSDIKRTPDLTHTTNNTEYALPNSKVSDPKGNPTDFNENVRTETGQETHHTETMGGVNRLDQTLRYIRGMKISWVNDFVEELKPCFCTLYL